MLALIADLEHPMDFWMTLRHYNPASWISRGSRIAMLFALATGGLLFVVRGGEDRGNWTQLGVPILAVLAVSLAIYPSLVLGQELGRPNWQSPCAAVYFRRPVRSTSVRTFCVERARSNLESWR